MPLRRGCFWLTASAVLVSAFLSLEAPNAEAVIEPMYTLPFYDSFNLACGFHCYYDPVYGWHEGVDYELGVTGVGGERVAAAASGTAKPCPPSPSAGNYIVINHGNGHRTRYLHLRDTPLPSDGQSVARGQVIGYEGSTGYTVPSGFNHLHFETRHAATTFTCGFDGTAVDPYAPSTYMWTTNPPSYAVMPGPDTCSWGANNLRVVVSGTWSDVWQTWWNGANWSGWQTLLGTATSDPSCVSRGTNLVDVFVRGSGEPLPLYLKRWDGSNWSGWEPLYGTLTSGPDACSWGPNDLRVVVSGGDYDVWQKRWNGTSWSAWQSLGGSTTVDPSCVSTDVNRVNVFARGSDGDLWQKRWDGSNWSGWEPLYGTLTSGPDACSWGPNDLRVVVSGGDYDVWQKRWNGTSWSAWESLGGTATSDPTCVSTDVNRVNVFARGSDGNLWQKYWNGSSWSGWTFFSSWP